MSGAAALHDLDVAIYDVTGRRIATIARGPVAASSGGVVSLAWDGRDAGGLPQRLGEIETGLARHHHIQDQQIEMQALQLGARLRGIVDLQ